MNFSGTTPKEIYKWIDDKNKGNDTEYIKCKQDTQEAIDVFLSLYGIQFRTAYQLFIHLKKHLCMTLNKSQSLYRAFIVLTNDEIITLRLSQHFAKRNSTEKALGKHRKPTMAYHLVIGRVEQDVNPKTDIYYDRIFKGVEIKVREYDLIEFNSNRKAIVDEIVYLLTNGTQPPKITDNKHYMNMNKQVIRLTEGDLHKIIKESVNEILDDPYDYAKVKGLSAAAFKAAKTPGADPKWAERKMRQSDAIKDRWRKLANEYSKLEDNDSRVDWAMRGMEVHRVKQGMKDPKGYIRRNGYGNYLKGVAESDLHRIVKESVDRILKEYTGDFGYSDDPNYNKFAQQNRPQQKQTPPLANYQPKRLGGNLVSNDGGESYIWDDSQQRQFGNNGTVEESTVNEVKYNGVSYHGTNPYDWVDVAQERQYKARGEEDKVSQYNRERFKAKDNGDFIGAENASNNADTHRQQWRIQNKKMNRNYDNAKQLGWKGVDWEGNGDTRLGKAQEYYNMSQNAQTPQDRQRYNKMAQDTLGDVEGRAQKSLNMLRAARGQA